MTCTGILTSYFTLVSLFGATFKHDPFETADPVVKFSFEADEDLDYDRQPDDWVKRKSVHFPPFIKTEIERRRGAANSRQSLRFDVNGANAVLYSPLVRVEPGHRYVFEGLMRTQLLKNDAARISLSLLDARRQRVQRLLSEPVTGTHSGWVRVRIGPFLPPEDARFLVIGCHLISGERPDLEGAVWFDELWLGKLPRLELVNSFRRHYVNPGLNVMVEARVGGLEEYPGLNWAQLMKDHLRSAAPMMLPGAVPFPARRTHQLHLELFDFDHQSIKQVVLPLNPSSPPKRRVSSLELHHWEVPGLPPGYYEVKATLLRDNDPLLEERTAIAILDLVTPAEAGQFGWSLPDTDHDLPLKELVEVAAQSGINWMEYPLWQAQTSEEISALARFLDQLGDRHVTCVGLLNTPPWSIRQKFSLDWKGVSEIFTMPSEFWFPSVEQTLVRYSAQVRHWQLGTDFSFQQAPRLGSRMAGVKSGFDRIGRDTRIGVSWDLTQPLPSVSDFSQGFLMLRSNGQVTHKVIKTRLKESASCPLEKWVVLQAPSADQMTPEQQGAELILQMVESHKGGAKRIFFTNLFHPTSGILHPDGSPAPLFLPWRTCALALQGTQHLGSFMLPNKSRNEVFLRENEAVVMISNEEPTEETIFLGHDIRPLDVWGQPVERKTVENSSAAVLPVGPQPLIIRGCNPYLAQLRLGVRYQNGKLRSQYGGSEEAILVKNPFPVRISGTVRLKTPPTWEPVPREWRFQADPGEEFRLPFFLTLPPNASLGEHRTELEFDLIADQHYALSVIRPYHIGTGEIDIEVVDKRLENGVLEIQQTLINRTEPLEILNFRCSLFVPNQQRQKQVVYQLRREPDRKLYYLPNADQLKGQELWLRCEQVDGNRVLNYRWIVGEKWDQE